MLPVRLCFQAMERVLAGTPPYASALSLDDMQIAPDVFAGPGGVPVVERATGSFSFGSGAGLIAGNYCRRGFQFVATNTTRCDTRGALAIGGGSVEQPGTLHHSAIGKWLRRVHRVREEAAACLA